MRISVVVIVYNLEAYIGQAIESVLDQTRAADEVIVVDDCSTDGSAQVAKAYGDRVRYIRMPTNSGALLTALQGIKDATGTVVCMLDGDDVWATNKLAIVEREFESDRALMLLSHDHVRVDENCNDLRIRDETHRNIAIIRRRAKSPEQLSSMLRDTILDQKGYWLGSAYSFRKSFFDIPKFEAQIKGFGFEQLRKTYLDLVIAPFLALTNSDRRIGYTADTTFFYRIHSKASLSGNLSPEAARRSALKGRTINQLIDRILRQNGASDAVLKRRQWILRHYDYLNALYSGDGEGAMRLYTRLAVNHWSWNEFKKETKRFIAVLVLGPKRFLDLKERMQRN